MKQTPGSAALYPVEQSSDEWTEEQTMRDVFGPTGPFASAFPGYEPREGQIQLAEACAEAIENGTHLISEAPCGVGKSQGYIVPALLAAIPQGNRVVIATANIALQEQIITKDLPLACKVLGLEHVSYALIKGRNNYLCHRQLEEVRNGGHRALPIAGQVDRLLPWANTTTTGDMSELEDVPSPDVWGQLAVTSEGCLKPHCAYEEECFANRAMARAWNAQVIVTNFHLLLAHLALRRESGQDMVLPKFHVLICDEAHELASTAQDFFGFQVGGYSAFKIAADLRKLNLHDVSKRLLEQSALFFDKLHTLATSKEYSVRLRTTYALHEKFFATLGEAVGQVRAIPSELLDEKHKGLPDRVKRACVKLAVAIRDGMTEREGEKVYYLETDKKKGRTKLCCKQIDCGPMLAEEMWGKQETVIAVSATLATGRGREAFAFIRRQMGVPDEARELMVDSPFDFAKQALLIVPEMPEPNQDGYAAELASIARKVINGAGGRTLCLFTSYKNLQLTYEDVSYRSKFTCLKQGESPRTTLTKRFRDEEQSCLFGTDSFWTGVDVQGSSLVAVLIDKLPFPSPDDPVLDAIQEQDRSAFFSYSVPLATIKLRQGVGRLIRSKKDFGVVVICDPRLGSKRYGKGVLASLPPMKATRNLDNMAGFFAKHGHMVEAPPPSLEIDR